MFGGQTTLQGARRAEVFRRLLEEVRQARAASSVLVQTPHAGTVSWPRLRTTRTLCEQLVERTEQHRGLIGRDLSDKVHALIGSLEIALSEAALSALLGPEDDSGRGALGRARRTIQQDSAYLESSIREQMATLVAAASVSPVLN